MENNEAIQEKIQALEKQLEGVRQRTRQLFTDGKEASKITELPDLNASINLERHKNSKLFQRFLQREGVNLDKDKPKVIDKKPKEAEKEVIVESKPIVKETKPEIKKPPSEKTSPDMEQKSFMQDEELQGYSEHVPADDYQETMFLPPTKPTRDTASKKAINPSTKFQESPIYEDTYPRKGNQNQFEIPSYKYNEPKFDDSVQYEPDSYSPPAQDRLDYNEYQDYRTGPIKESRYPPEPSYKESSGRNRETPPNRLYSEESYDPYYSEPHKAYSAQNTDGFNNFQDPLPSMVSQHSLPSISQNIPNVPSMPSMANLAGMPNMAGIPGQFMPMYPPMFYPPQPMDMMFRAPNYDLMHSQIPQIPQVPFYQNNDPRMKDELERQRREYEDQLAKRDAEIRNLQKNLENAKLDVMQMEDQLNNGGDMQRKYNNLKVERDMLDRKYQANEDEIIKLTRQYDQLKDTYDGLKVQYDDMDRSARAKISDLERELRSLQVKLEDAEDEMNRERDRALDLERKFNAVKDKCMAYERDLERADDKILRLERELDDIRNKQAYESRSKNSEADALRRQVASLTQAIEDLRRTGYTKQEEPVRSSYSKRREPEPSYYRYEEPDSNFSRYEEPDYSRRNYREEWDRPVQDMEEGKDIYNRKEYMRESDNTRDNLSKRPIEDSGPIRGRNVERTNNSKSVGSALHWEDPGRQEPVRNEPARNERKSKRNSEPDGNAVQNLENKLMTLQLEKQRLESEYSKIPEHAKQIAVRRRREDLELELSILDTNIANMKNKLRGMNALH
jgi:hypothetical protein